MARYIDADALKSAILKKYRGNWEIPCSSEDRLIQRVVTDLRVLIEKSIAADVAPKSEVEWLEKENARLLSLSEYNRSVIEQDITDAKAEVAREIFEELLKEASLRFDGFRNTIIFPLDYYNELKKKYTGEQT